jgi:integrase
LADIAASSLATGLRVANATGLKWNRVDLNRQLARIHPDQAKARRAIALPLNGEAMMAVQQQVDKHPLHVFSFRDRPVVQLSTRAWDAALERAGIEDFLLAWSLALPGVVARADRHAAVRVAEVGWVSGSGDGAARCAPCVGSSAPYAGRLCAVRAVAVEGDGTSPEPKNKGSHCCKPLKCW